MPELAEDFKELVRLLVDQPDEVEVTEIPSKRGGGLLELTVAPDDLGKVIGRQGRTARALRTLLETREDRRGVRHELEILED
ncbi:MAG TPA: KH domain-containing protein [Thermoanaerobaculia bacterium]|nr:KH domain-containing protein [Thermoanaerobaculia bacterium]